MAKTLLNAVNAILKRTGNVSGDAGLLTTLTNSPRQRSIDVAVDVINEGIDQLYLTAKRAMPKEQAQSTFTLVAATRAYTLATDLVQMRWPMIDKTNGQYLTEYPGGFNDILIDEPLQTATGLPLCGAISPVDGTLYLDRIPTSVEAGKIYTYQYDKDLELVIASDTVPFSNTVFRAMVVPWVQLWRRDQQNEFDAGLYKLNLGAACVALSQSQPRTNWCPR